MNLFWEASRFTPSRTEGLVQMGEMICRPPPPPQPPTHPRDGKLNHINVGAICLSFLCNWYKECIWGKGEVLFGNICCAEMKAVGHETTSPSSLVDVSYLKVKRQLAECSRKIIAAIYTIQYIIDNLVDEVWPVQWTRLIYAGRYAI